MPDQEKQIYSRAPEEPKFSAGRTAISLINPLTSLKYQFFSIWALPDYCATATGARGLSYRPAFILSHFAEHTGVLSKLSQSQNIVAKGIKWWLSPHSITGGGAELAMSKFGVSGAGKAVWLNKFREIVKVAKAGFGPQTEALISNLVGHGVLPPTHILSPLHVAAITAQTTQRTALLKGLVEKTLVGAKAGTVAMSLITGYMIGTGISHLAGMAYKAGAEIMTEVQSVAQHMRNLEFGGHLSVGYQERGALTERQRAISLIQRTHSNASRFMGNEASNYSQQI